MKLPRKKPDETSATITQTLGLIVVCSGLFVLSAYATDPSWWSTPGTGSTPSAVVAEHVVTNDGVVTTNYVPDDYAAVTQGQLKQFTARAVTYLNANLTNGAGTNLNTMASNWASDYATNGYNATNIEPSDYTAMNVGQLKYIGNKVWAQLVAGGYTNAVPSWLATNSADHQAANLGQLKELFDFSISTGTAATPTFSPGAGTYTSSQTVTISSSTSGATIYYTTDGSTPTTSSSSMSSGGTISVATSETVKAIAVVTGYTNSSVASAGYTIETAAATPTFSPAAGTYTSSQTVTLSSTTSGATIYYTIDGSTPTTSSSSVSSGGTISVATSETVKAIAAASGYTNSSVASASYTIETAAATPTFSPTAGTYTSSQTVTLSSTTSGATIYYTTNGSTPTTSSSSVSSGGTISVSASETVKAIAAASGYTNSSVASASYTIETAAATPTFSPTAGTYTSSQTVTLSSSTSGATIYYTTDGSTPTTSSSSVSSGGTISVTASETVKAIAAASGYTNSSVASAGYTIETAAVAPTFSPVAGTYTSSQTVTLSSSTSGATIYYTTDGSTPTTSSSSVSSGGTTTVAASETVNAIAAASGYTNSSVASAGYTIETAAATPAFSPAAGTYANTQIVTASSTTPSATIYYTTDGSTPTTGSLSVFSGGTIAVAASETLKAIAVAIGYNSSATLTAAYEITSSAAPPSTGLSLWLKADAGVTLDGSGNVSEWADQSGNGNDAIQDSASNRPAFISNDQNGIGGIRFSHFLSNYLAVADNSSLRPANGVTVIAVSKPTADGQYGQIVSKPIDNSSWNSPYTSYSLWKDTSNLFHWLTADQTSGPIDIGQLEAFTGNQCYLLSGTYDQVEQKFYVAGLLQGTASHSGLLDYGDSTAKNLTIGVGNQGGNNFYSGDICEVLVYNQALSDSDRQQAELYLELKYGLVPYVSAPTITPNGGSYTSATTVTISSVPVPAVIHYTLDGSEPTVDSPTYTVPFTISASAMVQAAAFINGQVLSPVASAQFYINDTGDTGLPVTPTSLTATSISGSETDLAWTLSGTVNYSAINVYRSTGGGAYVLVAVLDPSATSYADQDVVAGDSYTYKVGTINSSGISDSSASSSVTPPTSTTLTITVTTPSGATALP